MSVNFNINITTPTLGEHTHLDQIVAYFAGMEKMLKALPNGATVQLLPGNGNGHQAEADRKEVTSGKDT